VFTHEGYRRLLHKHHDYVNYLRSLLSTHTFLFIGCSFTDEYINELRREAMTMMIDEDATGWEGEPLHWALMPNMDEAGVAFFERHEGMRVLTWNLQEHGYAPMDAFMAELAEQFDSEEEAVPCPI